MWKTAFKKLEGIWSAKVYFLGLGFFDDAGYELRLVPITIYNHHLFIFKYIISNLLNNQDQKDMPAPQIDSTALVNSIISSNLMISILWALWE